ncbi:hypothetical protein L484_017447 [Morus notabilis]|uniref:Uncharacterized protein n=1 Tax=Morus notabilis TaxID=981085 RepID=W9QL82_9ROSA|nr:hypothetical protein L484_017447 [Morus notabilis]
MVPHTLVQVSLSHQTEQLPCVGKPSARQSRPLGIPKAYAFCQHNFSDDFERSIVVPELQLSSHYSLE